MDDVSSQQQQQVESESEWKTLIQNYYSQMRNVDIETFNERWMQHPEIHRFINWKDRRISNGATMLICAIWKGRYDVAKLLMEHGADIKIADEDGDSPLNNAADQGYIDIVKLLIDRGADLNIVNENGETALMKAFDRGHVDIVKLLVEKGADIKIATKAGETALMKVYDKGHIDIVKLLLDKGADYSDIILVEWKKLIEKYDEEMKNVNIENFKKWMEHPKNDRYVNWKDGGINYGRTMLQCAILQKRFDIAKSLLDHGADSNIPDTHGYTAAMHASLHGYTDIVELLVEKGADLNMADGDHKVTPLIFALKGGHTDVADLLVEQGADLNMVDIGGETALIWAVKGGLTKSVERLVERGADIKITNEAGETALMKACDKGHTDIVELLLNKGADDSDIILVEWKKVLEKYDDELKNVNIETFNKWMEHPKKDRFINWKDGGINYGRTMLQCAILQKRMDIAKSLLDHGADSNIPDTHGYTAAMHASLHGHADIVELLVEKGADLNVADGDHEVTPLIFALKGGHTDVAELLVEKGADLNMADVGGETALMWAAKGGLTKIVGLLMDKCVHIDISNNDGTSALMHASDKGYADIVKLLVEKGADITTANYYFETSLMKAYDKGHADIVEFLLDKGADDSDIILMEWKKLLEEYDNELKNVNIETFNKWMEHPKKDRFFNCRDVEINYGRTMLLCAILQKRLDIAKSLLEHDADSNIPDTHGYTAAMHASLHGHADIVELLVAKGADLNMSDWDHKVTPLIFALKGGHTDVVEILVEKGADLNIADIGGETALIWAVKGGLTKIVELLADKGADINTSTNDGTTALMHASQGGFMDIVKLLLEKGADITTANNDGETASMKASQGGYNEIAELLMEWCRSRDIGSLLAAGVTVEKLEELYKKEKVQNVVQAGIVEETEEEANRVGRPAAPAALKEDDNAKNDQVPPIPAASKIQRSRTQDIGSLLDAGVKMDKLEELYPEKKVHNVAKARIVKQVEEDAKTGGGGMTMEEEIQRRRRGSMARLLFLRSRSTSLKEVLRSSAVMDQVLLSLLADPEQEILMCPLMMTPMKDPVVINSGFVMDRSIALDENGNLRMRLCPFSRKELSLPVYPCIPIRSKLKAWEAERMDRCIEVAEKMVESKEWERATKVFDIAEALLQEMGDTTYLNLATKLANLERRIPFIDNDVERMVKIHLRLIRAAKGDKGETQRLLRDAIKDCCQKLRGLMMSDDFEECMKTRSTYSKEVLAPTALIDNQAELRDEILGLYEFDLALAKKLNSTTAIWSSRRRILFLLETQSGDEIRISEFLKMEGLTGNERELNLDSYDSSLYWPQDKLVDTGIGLVRFDNRTNARDGVETINYLSCKVDLNPRNGSDHWVEVAFRAIELGYPSYKFVIFSQCGAGTGWEIRVGKLTYSDESNFVEAVWTTTDADRRFSHNTFMNRHVPVDPGQWYHVILSFNSSTSEVKLYVNGQPESKTVEGTFIPDSRLPMIGQNFEWRDRQFKGMVAYASGDTQFPVAYAEADIYAQSLSNGRLQKLRECSEAMVELDLTAGFVDDYFEYDAGDY